MSAIVKRKDYSIGRPVVMTQGGQLWRHAPVRDSEDQSLCDLMMLLPGIKSNRNLQVVIRHQLQQVLNEFGEQIRFADLNLHLGIVWVTVASEPGLCGDVADAIRSRVEGARIVGNYVKCSKTQKLPWMERVKRLLT